MIIPIFNFNFKINQGEKIAIIGNSGSGKSTIVKCLIGILSINGGNIYIDDIDSGIYDNKWLKEKIGYVAQDSILFSDTIANNIAYGIDNPQEEDIINAAIKANAHEFISKLPNKYQTLLDARNALIKDKYTPSADLSQFEGLLGKLEASKMKQAGSAALDTRRNTYAQGLAQMMSNF